MGDVVLIEFPVHRVRDLLLKKNYISHSAYELNDLPADGFVCCGCYGQQGALAHIDGERQLTPCSQNQVHPRKER